MTQAAATDLRQWLVSARSRGELLTSTARAPGIELVMVGVPPGHSAEEIESWLRDLIGMALETSSAETGERPIPALLHHLLTGLLFSHSELWGRSDGGGYPAKRVPANPGPPASFAFVRTANEVSFGWVDGPEPDLWIDDHPARVEWVKIRDHAGREANALAIDPSHRVRVHFAIGMGPAATVDAAWVQQSAPAGSAATPAASAAPATSAAPPAGPGQAGCPVPTAAQAPDGIERSASTFARAIGARASTAESVVSESPFAGGRIPPGGEAVRPPLDESAGEGWTVVYEGAGVEPPVRDERRPGNWWSNVVSWVSGSRRAGAPELPERIPPSPEPSELTARAVPAVSHPAAHAGMREIHLSPLAPEEPVASRAGSPSGGVDLPLETARLDPVPPRAPVRSSGAAAAPGHAAPAASTAAVPAAPVPSRAPAPDPDSPFIEPDFRLPLSDGTRARTPRSARRPSWSDAAPMGDDPPLWQRPWVWAVLVALLFVAGWMVGSSQHTPGESGPVARMLRAVGLGGARFQAAIQSDPPGAWIAVDGKDVARRTPATVELVPGTRQVTLSFADHGAAQFEVRGVRGEKVTLAAPLHGSLEVYAGSDGIPVAVSVDGEARGLAPVTIESLAPGTHEVRFSGPGLQPWGQTVQVRVREKAQISARAITSPATGVLEVRSLWTDAEGSEELTGATVYVDGERVGVTPFTLELPRGPHSVRVESRGEQSPVQVIDLPGGNQRFANFELGLGIERPTLSVLGTPIRVPIDQPSVISAALQGVNAGEAREMWLHLRQPDGGWRRSPMMMMKAPGGLVGTAVFPNTLLDSQGRTPFYISATNQTGDEFFSEVLIALAAAPPPRR